jgi:hypothetical protein
MSEYSLVEKPFMEQLAALGWTVIDQGVCTAGQAVRRMVA